jgi:hypothetical protein
MPSPLSSERGPRFFKNLTPWRETKMSRAPSPRRREQLSLGCRDAEDSMLAARLRRPAAAKARRARRACSAGVAQDVAAVAALWLFDLAAVRATLTRSTTAVAATLTTRARRTMTPKRSGGSCGSRPRRARPTRSASSATSPARARSRRRATAPPKRRGFCGLAAAQGHAGVQCIVGWLCRAGRGRRRPTARRLCATRARAWRETLSRPRGCAG